MAAELLKDYDLFTNLKLRYQWAEIIVLEVILNVVIFAQLQKEKWLEEDNP